MRRSQVTIYIIIGLVLILVLFIIIPKKISRDNDIDASLDVKEFESYFSECSRIIVLDANTRIGIHETIKEEYQDYVSLKIRECSFEYLEKLKEKGMSIKDAEAIVTLDINEVNAIVKIDYPVSIRYRSFDYTFQEYTQTFEKITRFKPEEVLENAVFSEDKNLIIEPGSVLELKDIKGKPAKEIYIKVSDKRDVNGDELEGNLVYGIYPIGYFSEDPIRIKLYVDNIYHDSLSIEKIRLAWQNPFSGKWYYFSDTSVEDGYIAADVHYSTNYGLIKEIPLPSGVPMLSTEDVHQGLNEAIPSGSSEFSTSGGLVGSTAPEIGYEMVNGDVEKIFYQIKSEMGGTYDLAIVPDCVPKGAYCWVGASNMCSPAAVYCTGVVNSISNEEKNKLFRHEIAHNIQQNNNGCPYSATALKEWGPEYYSGSTYYGFVMEKGKMLAQDAADLMLTRPGCTEQMVKDAAFCVPGAYEQLVKYCLKPGELSGYGDSGMN